MSTHTSFTRNGLLAIVGVAAVVVGALAATPGPATAAGAGRADGSTADCNSLATCYTPRQIQVAYDVTPLLDRGN